MRRLARGSAVLVMLLTAGCSADPGVAASGVTLDEYNLTVDEASLAPGATLSIGNEGAFGHTVVVSDNTGGVVAATDLIAPGESVTLEADWDPGQYRFTCRIVIAADDGDIVDHYARGMSAEVTVTG